MAAIFLKFAKLILKCHEEEVIKVPYLQFYEISEVAKMYMKHLVQPITILATEHSLSTINSLDVYSLITPVYLYILHKKY